MKIYVSNCPRTNVLSICSPVLEPYLSMNLLTQFVKVARDQNIGRGIECGGNESPYFPSYTRIVEYTPFTFFSLRAALSVWFKATSGL